MSLLAAVDLAGYQIPPNQFDDSNIVVKDGEYRLVSIRNLVEHKCDFDGNLRENEDTPSPYQLKCALLLNRGDNMEFWIPGTMQFHATSVNIARQSNLFVPRESRCCPNRQVRIPSSFVP